MLETVRVALRPIRPRRRYECRLCGTAVPRRASECPACESTEVGTYEL